MLDQLRCRHSSATLGSCASLTLFLFCELNETPDRGQGAEIYSDFLIFFAGLGYLRRQRRECRSSKSSVQAGAKSGLSECTHMDVLGSYGGTARQCCAS